MVSSVSTSVITLGVNQVSRCGQQCLPLLLQCRNWDLNSKPYTGVPQAGHYTKITFTNPEIPMCYLQPLENKEIMQHSLNISVMCDWTP